MLSARQKLLLKVIIEEFINTANAVGSLGLAEKYGLEVSPATIRNEMARLAELGLLAKSHASSGRRPTTEAFRWFLEEMDDHMDELDIIEISEVKEKLFQKRFNVDKLLAQAVTSLCALTYNTSLAMLNGKIYTSGIGEFIGQPEYEDLQRLKKILSVLEDYKAMSNIFTRYDAPRDVRVLIGEETGIDSFENTAVIYSPIKLHKSEVGYVCIIGPNRMNYARVIPALKYVVNTIQDAVAGW